MVNLNAADIVQLMRHPESVTPNQLEGLRELVKKHSYTPLYSVLLLQGISKLDRLHLEYEVNQHAFRLPSRSKLFHLIQNTSENDDLTIKEFSAKDEKIIISDTPIAPFTSSASTEEIDQEHNKGKEISAPEDTLSNEEEKENIQHTEHLKNQERDAFKDAELDELNKTILSYAVDATISFELTQLEHLENSDKEHKTSSLAKQDQQTEELQLPNPFVVKEEKNQHITSDMTMTFSGWLTCYLESSKSIDQHKKQEKSELVSNVTPEKVAFFSAVKKARESLDTTGLPVSETLAKIYTAQGNYPRAIEAYEKLILKIPEKKSFFALQIEKLKKNLNS